MGLSAIEWMLRHPLSGHPIALVRLVQLGAARESYFRAVTPEADSSARQLIGYWGSLDDAERGTLALYERASGASISGAGAPGPSLALIPQKPPPTSPTPGRAAAPAQHARHDREARALGQNERSRRAEVVRGVSPRQ